MTFEQIFSKFFPRVYKDYEEYLFELEILFWYHDVYCENSRKDQIANAQTMGHDWLPIGTEVEIFDYSICKSVIGKVKGYLGNNKHLVETINGVVRARSTVTPLSEDVKMKRKEMVEKRLQFKNALLVDRELRKKYPIWAIAERPAGQFINLDDNVLDEGLKLLSA